MIVLCFMCAESKTEPATLVKNAQRNDDHRDEKETYLGRDDH